MGLLENVTVYNYDRRQREDFQNEPGNCCGGTPMIASYDVLKLKVNAVQHEQVLNQMAQWIRHQERGRYVVVANTHSVMECQNNPNFERAAQNADLIIPDGMPLIWMGRQRGFPLVQRADGPGLMRKAMEISGETGWRHFFYGGTPKTLECLLRQSRAKWPQVQVSGSFAPPFRSLTIEEEATVTQVINQSNADILWVGLGCPKQEMWMWEHHHRLNVPVMLGVGQAFDLLAGIKHRAPAWMCVSGLEWLYRLAAEPRRLWKRYLINNSWFLWLVFLEEIKLRMGKHS